MARKRSQQTYRDEATLGAGDVSVIEGEVHSAIRVSEQKQTTHFATRVTLEVVIALLRSYSHAFWNKQTKSVLLNYVLKSR